MPRHMIDLEAIHTTAATLRLPGLSGLYLGD
jgi:hypothetical protein